MTTLVQLPYIAPWNWSQFHQYLTLRLLPGVESLTADRYSRTLILDGQTGWLSVRPLSQAGALELSISDSLSSKVVPLAERVSTMFDLQTDPHVIARHFAADPVIAPLVAADPALRLPSAFDPFELGVRAIIGQQVSVKAAVTIIRRLIDRLGEPLAACNPYGLNTLFPTAESIAKGNLDAIGMPTKRVSTLQAFAEAVFNGALCLNVEYGAEELIKRLCQLPGIGAWTAEYIALRGFAEPDAFPAADLGLLKAPIWGPAGISAKALTLRAESWRPWRAYAAMHIWQVYVGAELTHKPIRAVESVPARSPDP